MVCMATVLFPLQKGTEGCGLHGYSIVSFLFKRWIQDMIPDELFLFSSRVAAAYAIIGQAILFYLACAIPAHM